MLGIVLGAASQLCLARRCWVQCLQQETLQQPCCYKNAASGHVAHEHLQAMDAPVNLTRQATVLSW